jgi:hypothetical protein
MKIRLVVALARSAISFALPTFAQQTINPKTEQQIRVLVSNFDAACNRNDATAVAALYTDDGVTVLAWGRISRSAGDRKRLCRGFSELAPQQPNK